MNRHLWSVEEKEFMKNFVSGHSYREIQKSFLEKFGCELSLGQIKGYIGRNKLNTGKTGCFEKGNIPANKGKKMSKETYKKCQGTMFKKGNPPP